LTGLSIALLTLMFAKPSIQRAEPSGKNGAIKTEGHPKEFAYVISTDGVYRLLNNRAAKAPKTFHPAFVISSDTKLRVGLKAADMGVTVLNADTFTIQIRYSDGFVVRKGAAKTLTAVHEIDSAAELAIVPGTDQYLLVRWRGDENSCEYGFTLFRLDGETLTEVASNAYGCDL
jgi:hypothetical protein